MTESAQFSQDYLERDGQRIGVHRYPAPDETGPAVLVLPAMGVPAGYYRRFAAELTREGFTVAVADLRGTGSSRPRAHRGNRYGYAELVADVPVLLDRLAPELKGRRMLMLGHSLGGHVASLYLGTHPDHPVDALALVACGIPYYDLYPRPLAYGVKGFASALKATARLLGHWPGYWFAGRQTHGVIRDWAHTVHKGRFVDIDGIDSEKALGTVRLPVLAVTVDHDQFTPPVTTGHLLGKLTAATAATHHYGDDEAGDRLDHFRWAKAGGPLARRLRAFIDGA